MAVRDGGSARKPGAGLITESDVEPGRPAAGSPNRRGMIGMPVAWAVACRLSLLGGGGLSSVAAGCGGAAAGGVLPSGHLAVRSWAAAWAASLARVAMPSLAKMWDR